MGTCFGFSVDNKLVLITAKHLVAHLSSGFQIEFQLYRDNRWQSFWGTPLFHNDLPDIAIIESSINLKFESNVKFNESVIFGDDAYFLGFPYFGGNLFRYPGSNLNNAFPIPMIKKATISGILDQLCFLDGHNNPGFSGGPISFYDQKLNQFVLFGIISGYITHQGKVEVMPSANEHYYKENSGIIVAYTIHKAAELIKERFNIDV